MNMLRNVTIHTCIYINIYIYTLHCSSGHELTRDLTLASSSTDFDNVFLIEFEDTSFELSNWQLQ